MERALPEEALHKCSDVEADLCPERLVVRLKDHPLRPAVKTFLEEERGAPHRNVFPL